MNAETPPLKLGHREGVALATSLVQWVATANGIRTLVIKGPIAEDDGLRPRRPSHDVDVLTEPTRHAELVGALGRHGWRVRPAASFPTLLQPHSQTLFHESWPIDLDLHHSWPGFLTSPDSAFDALWARRRTVQVAGRPIETTGLADTAVVLALHSLRETDHLTPRDRRVTEYRHLVAEVLARPDLIPEIASTIHSTGSTQTAAPFLRALGVSRAVDDENAAADDALRLWRLHSAARHPVGAWLYELRTAPTLRKPAVLWRAVFPSAGDLRAIDPGIGQGCCELLRGWWRRIRRGIRTVPEAARDLRRVPEQ